MKKIFLTICACALIAFTGCAAKTKYPVSDTEFLLNTVSSIDIYACNGDDPEAIITDCFKYIRSLENTMSRTVDTSETAVINENGGGTVSDDTAFIIQKSLEYSILTDGAFDITIGGVSSLWDFTSDENVVPEDSAVKSALDTVGYENIEIDGNSVTLKNGARLDLGAIAKGYIGDKAAQFLKDRGVTSAIINLGGNTVIIGSNGDRPFRIGIQSPTGSTGSYVGVLNLSDKSAVTSGAYQRFFIKDGVVYHHILDPDTGYPAETDIASVTVIADSSADADALSTSCYILGAEKAVELIDSLPYAEAVIVTDDGDIILSSGADEFYEEYE